jgi:argininosuccinate lyase
MVLPAIDGCVATLTFDEAAMREACADEGLYATDLAEALVRSGVPFRQAHQRTGELLRRVESEGRRLRDLSDEDWTAFGVAEGASMLDPDAAIEARDAPGGPSPPSVVSQADALEASLARGGGGG